VINVYIYLFDVIQDKNWEVVDTSKNKVDQFKRTMPLIQDMKNKAMRPRHWTQIQVSSKSQVMYSRIN